MQIDLSPERIKELENEDIYAQSGGLVDTLGDIGQGSARGILKIPGQFADNMNGILDWTADKLIGEGDYRLQEVDKVKDWYQDKLNTYIPPEDTTAFKTSEAISNALASFLLLRKVVPIQNWFARSAVAEAGASLVRDPYEERLADIMADVGPDITEPLFEALRSKPDDPLPMALLKRAFEDAGIGATADGLFKVVGAIRGIKYAKSSDEATAIETNLDSDLKQLAKDIDDLEKLESTKEVVEEMSDGTIKRTTVPAGKPKIKPKAQPSEPTLDTKPQIIPRETSKIPKDKIFDSQKIAQKIIEKVKTGDLDETRLSYETDLPYFNKDHYLVKDDETFDKILITLSNGYKQAKKKLSPDKVSFDEYEVEAEEYLTTLGMGDFLSKLRESAKSSQELGGLLFAGKTAINWYTKELNDTAKLILSAPTENQKLQALARLDELELMMPNMGRIGAYSKAIQEGGARTTAMGRMDVRLPEDPMKFMDGVDIQNLYNTNKGADYIQKLEQKAKLIVEAAEATGRAGSDLSSTSRFRILRIAKEDTSAHKLSHFLSERFRRNILLNVPTLGINLVSNGIETVLRPVSELVMNNLNPIGDRATREMISRELKGQIAGIWWGSRMALGRAAKAFRENKAILDPNITQYEGVIDRGSAEYLFGASDLGKNSFMNTKAGSALRHAINLTGKPGEWSYKLLNATDEFYKELNYFGKRFGQEMADLSDEQLLVLKNGTKLEKDGLKSSIRERIMKDSFEDGGQALSEKDLYRLRRGLKDTDQVDTKVVSSKLDPNLLALEQTKLKEKRFKALEYAREASFTSEELFEGSDLTATGLKLAREMIQRNPYLQIFFPFVRTPVNIIAKGLRLTPATHLLRPMKLMERLRSDDPMVALKARTEVGLGTALSATAFFLVASDRITGAGPKDFKLRKAWLEKHQPYSIKVGDVWVDYGRFSPYSTPFKVAADMMDTIRYSKDDSMFRDEEVSDYVMAYIMSMTNVAQEESFTRGLKNLTDGIEALTSGTGIARAERFVEDIFASMVSVKAPGQVVGIFARDSDVGLRSTNSLFDGSFDSLGDQVLRNFGMPYAKTAPKYSWLTGEKVINSQYPIYTLGGAIPLKLKKEKDNFVLNEIIRLNTPGLSDDINVSIDDVPLSAEQQSRYQQLMGTVKYKGKDLESFLRQVIISKTYRKLPDDLKAKELMSIKRTYRKKAEIALMKEYPNKGNEIVQARRQAEYKQKLGIDIR